MPFFSPTHQKQINAQQRKVSRHLLFSLCSSAVVGWVFVGKESHGISNFRNRYTRQEFNCTTIFLFYGFSILVFATITTIRQLASLHTEPMSQRFTHSSPPLSLFNWIKHSLSMCFAVHPFAMTSSSSFSASFQHINNSGTFILSTDNHHLLLFLHGWLAVVSARKSTLRTMLLRGSA